MTNGGGRIAASTKLRRSSWMAKAMPKFSMFGEHLLRWNSREHFVHFPRFSVVVTAATGARSSSSYSTFHLMEYGAKTLVFNRWHWHFISDARVRQTPWGLPTLFTCCMSCTHRVYSSWQCLGHYCIQIHIFKRKFNFHLLFYVCRANTFGISAVVS